MPKKGGIIVVPNERNGLVLMHVMTDWRACIDNWKLNGRTEKDHFPMPFMDQILDILGGNGWYYFLDGY